MDWSLPDSSIHGIFQARVLEWGAIAFSDGRDWIWGKSSLALMGRAMLSKSSNFLLMGGAVLLLCSLAWTQTMVGVMATSSKKIYASILCLPALLLSVLLGTQQATGYPWLHQRFQNTHRQVWLSPLWAYCSCLLGPGAHKVLFVPSKHLWWVWSLIKHNWVPPTILVRLLLCPWMWGMFFGGFQHFAINRCSAASWEFSVLTGKVSTCPFTLPSWSGLNHWLLVNGLNVPLLSLPLEIWGWSESSSLLITWLVSLEAATSLRLPRGFPKVTPLT